MSKRKDKERVEYGDLYHIIDPSILMCPTFFTAQGLFMYEQTNQVFPVAVYISVSHSVRPSLCDPVSCSPSDSSSHGFLQTRILEWVAIPFVRDLLETQESNPGLLNCR